MKSKFMVVFVGSIEWTWLITKFILHIIIMFFNVMLSFLYFFELSGCYGTKSSKNPYALLIMNHADCFQDQLSGNIQGCRANM